MAKASDNAFPSVLLVAGAAPAAPATGQHRLYIDQADSKLRRIDSAGAKTEVGSGAGAGVAVRYSETFDTDPVVGGRYALASGPAVSVANGMLQGDLTTGFNITAINQHFTDHTQIIKARINPSQAGATWRLACFLRYASETSHLRAGILTSGSQLITYLGRGDGTILLQHSLGLPQPTGGSAFDAWVVGATYGRNLMGAFFLVDPDSGLPPIFPESTNPGNNALVSQLTTADMAAHGVGDGIGMRLSGGAGMLIDSHTVK